MARRSTLGRKVRRLRKERDLTQVQLAEKLGISDSYVTLIESGQRPVTAPLLIKLAKVFDLELTEFADDDEARLASDLTEVLGDPLFGGLEVPGGEVTELASTSPAACRAVLQLYQAYQAGRADLASLAERVVGSDGVAGLDSMRTPSEDVSDFLQDHANHFPEIESAAEELTGRSDLGAGDLDSRLVELLRRQHGVTVEVVSAVEAGPYVRRFDTATRRLVLSEVLAPRSRHFQLAHQIALLSHRELFDGFIRRSAFGNQDSRALCRVALANYFAGAVLMPYEPFLQAARSVRYDIEMLGHRFRTSFEQVCHRMTTLQRKRDPGVPFHMIRVDIAGNISKRFSASGIRFARYSGACPKWNVHAAFMTPGFIRTQISAMPDGTTYFCIARTVRKEGGGYQLTPSRFAIGLGCRAEFAHELVYADGLDVANPHAAVPVGITCRLCERSECAQRAFPALQQRMNIDENTRALSFYAGPSES